MQAELKEPVDAPNGIPLPDGAMKMQICQALRDHGGLHNGHFSGGGMRTHNWGASLVPCKALPTPWDLCWALEDSYS